jgi:hypothetical protein
MDLIIGVVIFLLAVGVIYSLLSSKRSEDITPLRIESDVVATKLTTPESSANQDIAVAEENQLNIIKLENLTTAFPYEDLKQKLGVQNEFCIYLQDENGNVVYLRGADGKDYTGIGSGKGDLILSNTSCGCPVGYNTSCR